MRVLVVDDISLICDLYGRLIRRLGHEVFLCNNPVQAVPMISIIRPDVLLLDIAMKEMDGFQIAEQLKNNPELRPKTLVAVTGYDDPAMRAKIAEAGFGRRSLYPRFVLAAFGLRHDARQSVAVCRTCGLGVD